MSTTSSTTTTTARSIFQAQQELVQHQAFVVQPRYEAGLLARRVFSGTTTKQLPTGCCKKIFLWKDKIMVQSTSLDVFAGLNDPVDKALLALTSCLEEFRMAKTAAPASSFDQIAQRIESVLVNFIKQCIGSCKTKLPFGTPKIEFIKRLWTTMADGVVYLLEIDRELKSTGKSRPSTTTTLTRHALDLIAAQISSTTTEKGQFCDAGLKVLKTWCDAATTGFDCVKAVALYLILHHVGYTAKYGTTPFIRVYALHKIAPVLPIVSGRKCVKFEDVLFENVSAIPTYATHLQKDLSSIRVQFTAQLSGNNLIELMKRLTHELAAKPSIANLDRTVHVVFTILHCHFLEKIPLPKSSIPPLAHLCEAVTACGSECDPTFKDSVALPGPPVVPMEALAAFVPQTSIALQRCKRIFNSARTLDVARAAALTLAWQAACLMHPQPSSNPASAFCLNADSDGFYSMEEKLEKWKKAQNIAKYLRPFPELFEPMLRDICESFRVDQRLPLLVGAFSVASASTTSLPPFMTRPFTEFAVKFFTNHIESCLRKSLVAKQSVDRILILQINYCLDCPEIELDDLSTFHLKSRVQDKLALTWHELRCTGIDQTWETYAEMKAYAQSLFSLDVYIDALLPGSYSHDVDTAMTDVLDIAKDVNKFASCFNYNMNQEFFVEKRPQANKYVNTVTVESISKSVRNHGSGILSTVVNSAYQFLAKRFEQLSQSLFDDHVKAFLRRERRWISKEQSQVSSSAHYSFERAANFAQDSKLGQEFLTQTRLLITEMGNALGFVRTVRAAGMKWAASVHRFLPGEAIRKLDELNEEAIPALLRRHAQDVAMKKMPDYLGLLLDVFKKSVETNKHEHLKNAFMIVPALFVDYVDASLLAKDQVARAHKNPHRDAYFTDDGFVVGVAAVLFMLNQDVQFDALKFFKGVAAHFEGPPPATTQLGGNNDDGFVPSLETGSGRRRVKGAAREYELLMYGFGGARAFLRREEEVAGKEMAVSEAAGVLAAAATAAATTE